MVAILFNSIFPLLILGLVAVMILRRFGNNSPKEKLPKSHETHADSHGAHTAHAPHAHDESHGHGHDDHHDEKPAAAPPKKDSHGHGGDHGGHGHGHHGPDLPKSMLTLSRALLGIAAALVIFKVVGTGPVPATTGAQALARQSQVVTTTEQSTSSVRVREIMHGTVPTGTEWLAIAMVPNKTLFMCREDDPDCSQKTLEGVVTECRDVTFDVFRPKASETCTGVREMRFQSAGSEAVPVFWYFE